MGIPAPRRLLTVLVDVDRAGTTVTFYLGERFVLERPAEWSIYGLAVKDARGAVVKHLGARFSPSETKAYVVEFDTATQKDYDASHVDGQEATVTTRFPGASLGVDATGSATGFVSIDGDDVVAGVPARLLVERRPPAPAARPRATRP